MENKEFYIDKDGFKLHAKLDFPKGCTKEKLPLLIVIHGLTGHMEERHIIGVANAANEAGYASLRVELYGHGKSDGKFCNHNIAEWVTEILYVIDFARELDFVTDIFLTGHSQGGLSVMLAAALKADQIKALLPLSPALCIIDFCINGTFFDAAFDPDHLPDKIYYKEDKYVTSNYFRIGKTLPITQAIRAYKGPVLIVHGTEDEAVPYFYAEDSAAKYKNATLITIPGDDHCYNYHLEQVETAVKEFLLSFQEQ